MIVGGERLDLVMEQGLLIARMVMIAAAEVLLAVTHKKNLFHNANTRLTIYRVLGIICHRIPQV